MSIVFEEVEEAVCERAAYFGTSKFIRATINPATKEQLNLPDDYKFHSVFLPRKYADWAERLLNFKVRKDDVWIVGFMKTGTTRAHNIAWQLKNGLKLDAPARRSNDQYFEIPLTFEDSNGDAKVRKWIEERDALIEQYDRMPSPRIFKSDLPAFLLPKEIWTVKPKIIYTTRNPKDVIVSYYYMCRNNAQHYTGTLKEFCDMFVNNQLIFTPFIEHTLSYWQLRHLNHVLFLTYEQVTADLFAGVKRICGFLECSYTDDQLQKLTEYVSFGNMSKQFLENTPAEFAGGKLDPGYR